MATVGQYSSTVGYVDIKSATSDNRNLKSEEQVTEWPQEGQHVAHRDSAGASWGHFLALMVYFARRLQISEQGKKLAHKLPPTTPPKPPNVPRWANILALFEILT